MAEVFLESANDRHKRYEKAQERMDMWLNLFQTAYRYAIPDRDDFFKQNEGASRMNDVFDTTAVEAVKDYAGNIQSILTPPYTKWAKLVPGDLVKKTQELTDVEYEEAKETLEEYTETLFMYLDSSNFTLKANESLQDLSVSTGVLILNEGDRDHPFQFLSVPLSQVAVSEGEDGTLQNFWRKWEIEVRLVPLKWPKMELDESLTTLLKNNPNQKINLIEGCINYPQNSDDKQFFYYVQHVQSGVKDLFFEWREYNPFIGFRGNVSPGEILGRGPTLRVLPDIKKLNKYEEMALRGASMRAFPITLLENNAVLNPHNFTLNAGDIIPVEPSVSGKDPIRPMEVGGDVNFEAAYRQLLIDKIKTAYAVDPLGEPEKTVNQTATQTQIRQSNWARKNGAAAARLTSEWLNQVLDKCIRILRKKNILSDIVINGKTIELKFDNKLIGINYQSPLLDAQNQEDAQRLEAHIQFIGQNFGATGITATYNLSAIPGYMAEKMGVPQKLLNTSDQIQQRLNNLAQQAQKAAQAQAQAGQQPIPAGQQAPEQLPPPEGMGGEQQAS